MLYEWKWILLKIESFVFRNPGGRVGEAMTTTQGRMRRVMKGASYDDPVGAGARAWTSKLWQVQDDKNIRLPDNSQCHVSQWGWYPDNRQVPLPREYTLCFRCNCISERLGWPNHHSTVPPRWPADCFLPCRGPTTPAQHPTPGFVERLSKWLSWLSGIVGSWGVLFSIAKNFYDIIYNI